MSKFYKYILAVFRWYIDFSHQKLCHIIENCIQYSVRTKYYARHDSKLFSVCETTLKLASPAFFKIISFCQFIFTSCRFLGTSRPHASFTWWFNSYGSSPNKNDQIWGLCKIGPWIQIWIKQESVQTRIEIRIACTNFVAIVNERSVLK